MATISRNIRPLATVRQQWFKLAPVISTPHSRDCCHGHNISQYPTTGHGKATVVQTSPSHKYITPTWLHSWPQYLPVADHRPQSANSGSNQPRSQTHHTHLTAVVATISPNVRPPATVSQPWFKLAPDPSPRYRHHTHLTAVVVTISPSVRSLATVRQQWLKPAPVTDTSHSPDCSRGHNISQCPTTGHGQATVVQTQRGHRHIAH